jgi:hypothetical protein
MVIGLALVCAAAPGCSTSHTDYSNRPFFRTEYGLETHGRKTWFDHLVEVDPGGIKTTIAPNFEEAAPERVAVLPFGDLGSANFVVDKIKLTYRTPEQKADWAWTDANRLRRAIDGYMAQREFVVANLIQVDEILKAHGIDTEKKLDAVPAETLGKWLNVDAVVYGDVTHYEAYYAALVSAWRVGAKTRIVSTHNGEELFAADGSRWSVNLMPAFDPIDIMINSGLSLLELRDVTLARAEEETAREIVVRVPRSQQLQSRLIEEALNSQEEIEFTSAQ